MALIPYYDPILDELRARDTATIPDPLIVNNLSVNSLASINLLYGNGAVLSTATLGLTHMSTIDWNLTSGATVTQEGQMNWDANQQTAVIGMAGGNVDLALGMETLFPRRVRNSTGSTMPKGTVVYINGVSGNTPTVERAIATSDMTSAFTLGMTAEDIADTATGWVTTFGELTGLDLSSFTGGDTLYLSGATAGAFTNVPQSAPNHYVRVGTVVKATVDGALVVNVINGYELNELHNVAITSLASGQILQSGVSELWYNRSLASAVNELNLLASLGSLAYQNTVDYNTQITNRPSLGSLAVRNSLSYTELTNLPSLGSLAYQNTVDYTQITNAPSIPSLGSLAVLNTVTQPYLPSNASFNILHTNTIVNASTISTNRLVVTDLGTFKAGTVSTPAFNFAQTPSLATTQWEVGWYVDVPFPTVAPWARTLNWTINNTNGGRFADSGLQMASGAGPTGPSYTFLAETQSGMYFDTSTNRPSFTNYGTRSGAFAIGQFIAEDGTEVTPSIGFFSETQTGFFLANSANPQIGFTAEGSEIGRFGWTTTRNVPRFSINSTSLGLAVLAANQGNASTAIPALYLNQVDLDQAFIDLRTTVSAGNPINTTTLGTYYGKFRVEVNGTAKWVGLYN